MFARAAAYRSILLAFFLALAATVSFGNSPAAAAPCERLAHLSLPNTRITSASGRSRPEPLALPAPANAQGGAGPSGSPFAHLPAFCRVKATLTPSSDSDIKIEVWLPASGWNSKLQSVGNGGWAGIISYTALARGVAEGYAAASTDTGHSTSGGSFALGHPEKMTDFAYRSVHVMTVAAKLIVAAFYGKAPAVSYWNGCSTGGGRVSLKHSAIPPITTPSSQARPRTIERTFMPGLSRLRRRFTKTNPATSRRANTP